LQQNPNSGSNFKMKILLLVALWLGCQTGAVLLAESSKSEAVELKSLEWGEVLFYHFSGQKTQALIRLYARESRNQFPEEQDQVDLLAAGLLLDLGLVDEAQRRLDKLGLSSISVQIKSRLSFAMSRVYFQQQNFDASQRWLNLTVESHLIARERSAKKMMQAQIYFNKGDYELAAEALDNISDLSNLQYYAFYNHGLSLLNLDSAELQSKGRELIRRVAVMLPTDQEQYALVDQAKLALGLEAINSGNAISARKWLMNTRLDGIISNDALLLLGWSFAQTQQFPEAITYWKTLSQRQEPLEPTVQESWLALPYAYQELGDLKAAVNGYQSAIRQQSLALKTLDDMRLSNWWRIVLDKSLSEELTETMKSSSLERQLIADPKFYNVLSHWQQLNDLKSKLEKSLNNLPIIALVLNENALKYNNHSNNINEILAYDTKHSFDQNLQQLKAEYFQQKQQFIAPDFLSAKDHRYWQKLQSMQQIIKQLPSEIDASKIEQYRRLDGIAKWRFNRQRTADEYKVKSSLESLEESLSKMTVKIQRLKQLASNPQKSIDSDIEKVDRLVQQGETLNTQIALLLTELETAMSTRFELFVVERETALKQLAEQANIALARLQFQSIQKLNSNE